jgi:hypothetical protein
MDRRVYLKIGIWHFSVSVTLGELPSIIFAGGKHGGDGGYGGNGYFRAGSGAQGGTGESFAAGGSGGTGGTGEAYRYQRRVNLLYNSNIFLTKGSLLFYFVGFNGGDGLDALYLHTYDPKLIDCCHSRLNVKRAVDTFQSLDGGGGAPGLPSCVVSINPDKPMYWNNTTPKHYLFLDGLIADDLNQKYRTDSIYGWKHASGGSVQVGAESESKKDLSIGFIDVSLGIGIKWIIIQIYQCVLETQKYTPDANWVRTSRMKIGDTVTGYPKNYNDFNALKSRINSDANYYGPPINLFTANDNFLWGETPKVPSEVSSIFNIELLGNKRNISFVQFTEGFTDAKSNLISGITINYNSYVFGESDPGINMYIIDGIKQNDTNYLKDSFEYY